MATDITILIVEDSTAVQSVLRQFLENKAKTILSAFNIQEAWQIFIANKSAISLIIMDARVPKTKDGEMSLTVGLTIKIRKIYHGPMIASSTEEENNKALVAAGCSDSCLKENLPDILGKVLAGINAK